MRKILSNKLYLSVLGLDLLSNFGDSVYYLALMNYVLLLPEPKTAIAVVTMSETLPILSAFIMGYLADKQTRKVPLIITTQFFRFAIYLVVGLVMGFPSSLWVVVAVSLLNFLSDMSGQFEGGLYQPISLRVLAPEEREQGMAFSSSVFQTMAILFKFSGAALVAIMTYQNLAYLNAFTFLVCAVGMLFLSKSLNALLLKNPITVVDRPSEESLVADLWSSLKLALTEMNRIPAVRFAMLVVPLFNAVFASIETFVLLVMTEDKTFGFGSPALTLSVIGVVMMVGGLLGNIAVMSGRMTIDLIRFLRYGTIVLLPIFLTLYWHQNYLFLAVLLLTNFGIGIVNPKMGALVKNSLPEDKMGMIFSGMATYFQLGVILMKVLLAGLMVIFPAQHLMLVMLVLSVGYIIFSFRLDTKEVS